MVMKPLGPMASYQGDDVSPTEVFYVDITDRLGEDEVATSAIVTSDVTGIGITEAAPIDAEYEVWWSGKILGVGKAIKFRVTITVEMKAKVPITVTYTTDEGNTDSLEVPLLVYVKVP